MAKSLAEILKGSRASKKEKLSLGKEPGVDYAPKSQGDRDFVAAHEVEKFEDRAGNDEDVYNASNVKRANLERKGHVPDPKDSEVYKKANEETISEAKCNMTEAGTMCELHGNKDCKSGSSDEPRYKGKVIVEKQPKSMHEEAILKAIQAVQKINESEFSNQDPMDKLRLLSNKAMAIVMSADETVVNESWVQRKITEAEKAINEVNHYMDFKKNKKSVKEGSPVPVTFPEPNKRDNPANI